MTKKLRFLLLLLPFLSQAQVSLVMDINPTGDAMPTYENNRVALGNTLFFAADDNTEGMEIWTTDGTSSGTQLIQNLRGNGSSNPREFFVFDNRVLFLADFSASLAFIVQSDGTSPGTGAYAPTQGFTLPSFEMMNSELYFVGNGQELFKYQSGLPPTQITTTLNGTKELTNLNDSELIFQAADPAGNFELWRSDGTSANTQLLSDIFPGVAVGSAPNNFIEYNNKIYFTADDGVSGRELWVTDGTAAGTNMVIDLYSGPTSSNPTNLTIYNNTLFFCATNPALGREVFKMTTLENVSLLKNIVPGSNGGNPENLIVSNGLLYFTADDGINGRELWSSTGFNATTNMLKDINTSPATPDSNPNGFTEYFGELFFAANDGINGVELWKTDGTTAGTVLVEDINLSGDSNPKDLIVANNFLFFSATNGTSGTELWKYQDPSLSVNDISNDTEVLLFPNPTNQKFTIQSQSQIYKVSIFDINGKLIKQFNESKETYAIEELTSGLYVVTIQTNQGFKSLKLIKE